MHKLDEYPEDRIQLLPFVSLSTFLYDVLRKWSGAIAEMLAAGRHVLDAGLHDRDALQCGDSVYSGHWSWKHHRWGCRRRLAKNQGPQKTIMSEYEYMYRLCTLSTKFRRYVFFEHTWQNTILLPGYHTITMPGSSMQALSDAKKKQHWTGNLFG